LNKDAFLKVMQKYARSLKLKQNVVITFDKRLVHIYGDHDYDYDKDCHLIRLAIDHHREEEVSKWRWISTGLHELKHAQQQERYSDYAMRNRTKSIKEKESSNWFSRNEAEARSYEDKHLHNAVDLYESLC